jgi:hypothetical protein
LLDNLCQRSEQTRDEWKNSYSGGTVTGVGILKSQFDQITHKVEFRELLRVLSVAISANYFEKVEITQGSQKKKWIVLYYNSWICVK